jgi:hypothetical protein
VGNHRRQFKNQTARRATVCVISSRRFERRHVAAAVAFALGNLKEGQTVGLATDFTVLCHEPTSSTPNNDVSRGAAALVAPSKSRQNRLSFVVSFLTHFESPKSRLSKDGCAFRTPWQRLSTLVGTSKTHSEHAKRLTRRIAIEMGLWRRSLLEGFS